MTRVCEAADVKDEKSTLQLYRKFPIASSRVLKTMLHMPIWFNEQFILTAASEACIHAACFVPFMMCIKGMLAANCLEKSTTVHLSILYKYNTRTSDLTSYSIRVIIAVPIKLARVNTYIYRLKWCIYTYICNGFINGFHV